jgi:hypothetical protein
MGQLSAKHLPISADVAREGARRAAERIPPCKPGGEGMRDALIWASLIEATKPGASYERVAFVSRNTKDFGVPDGSELKEELAQDVTNNLADIAYYPSLDAFLKERAEPVAHIDRAWVLDRLDMNEVRSIMEGWVYSRHYEEAMRASGFDWDDLWEQNEVLKANPVLIELTEFYVWQFDDDHLELRMRFRASFDLDITPIPRGDEHSLYPSSAHYPREGLYPGSVRQNRQERWDVQFDLPARITDDQIVELGMEDPVLYGVSYSP